MAHANSIKTIKVKVRNGSADEMEAAGAIMPGHLVKQSAGADTCVVHAQAGGPAQRLFAVEDALQGNTVDMAYASGDRVQLVRASRGDRINALIKAGENIAKGDFLASGGDGTLIEASGVPTGTAVPDIIGVAVEALNLTASGATAGRCLVDIL